MKNVYSHLRNSAYLIVLALPGFGSAANAQTDAQATTSNDKRDQTIQRIRTEDAGSRIDEVRVGGQTQSITVQPKVGGNIPAYEVKPLNAAGSATPSSSSSDTTGPRVWNVLKF